MSLRFTRRSFIAAGAAGALTAALPAGMKARVSTMKPSDVLRLSVREGISALQAGQLGAEEYCRASLAQAERYRSHHMFSQLGAERALEAARAVDRRRSGGEQVGALGGLPYALKDSVDHTDFFTIAGHPAMKTFRPTRDADLVDALRRCDGVCLGKTQIPPLSLWWTTENPMTGDTGNPFNRAYKTGGSSGGSGAAVAARIVPFAIAEDTGGSIRVPAGVNGVLGLRPTTGRWPIGGAVPIGFTDTLGPIARTVADLALLDGLFSTDGPHDEMAPARINGLRIGFQRPGFVEHAHPWVADNFNVTLDRLRGGGAELVEINNLQAGEMRDLAVPLLLSEFPDALARYFDRHNHRGLSALGLMRDLDDSAIRRTWLDASIGAPTGEQRHELVVQLRAIRKANAEKIAAHGIDALIYPTTLVPNTPNDGPVAMEIEGPLGESLSELAIGANMFFAPAMRAPSLAMFSGMDPDGLPLSVTLDAPSGEDRRLLAIAAALEPLLPALEAPRSS